jgi:hypothetical protein
MSAQAVIFFPEIFLTTGNGLTGIMTCSVLTWRITAPCVCFLQVSTEQVIIPVSPFPVVKKISGKKIAKAVKMLSRMDVEMELTRDCNREVSHRFVYERSGRLNLFLPPRKRLLRWLLPPQRVP